ncbi:hypothetical protein D043_4159A, partial [Vibrio parahaemolyticus EKP-021]
MNWLFLFTFNKLDS